MHWHGPLLAVILHEPCIQTHDAVHAKAREAYVIKALLIRASRDAVAAVLFIHVRRRRGRRSITAHPCRSVTVSALRSRYDNEEKPLKRCLSPSTDFFLI
jgi:hypothetical protein